MPGADTGSLLDLIHVQFEDRVLPTGSNTSAETTSRSSQGLYFTVNLQMFAERITKVFEDPKLLKSQSPPFFSKHIQCFKICFQKESLSVAQITNYLNVSHFISLFSGNK